MPYNLDPNTPAGQLPGFTTPAAPQTPSIYEAEIAQGAAYIQQKYPDVWQRQSQFIQASLRQAADQLYIDPTKVADAIALATIGVETVARTTPGAPGGADDPYRSTAAAAKPTLTAPVQLDRLPPQYAETLKFLNVKPETVDEYLTRFMVGTGHGQEPTLERARDRFVRNAMKGDVDTDHRTVESPVYGVPTKVLGQDG